jgi:hypothetical protein
VGEKGRVRTALAILAVAGALMVWNAFVASVSFPDPMWGLATLAAGYLFASGAHPHRKDDDD